MKLVKVKLSKAELRELFFFHTDAVDDVTFTFTGEKDIKTIKLHTKKAKKYKKILAKRFNYEV